MCSSGASRQSESGGLYPNGKVAICSSRVWGIVFFPASRRAKILGYLDRLVSGAVDTTRTRCILSQWYLAEGGGIGPGLGQEGGGEGTIYGCAGPAWRACVGWRRSGAAGMVRRGSSRFSMYAWTWIRAMDNARALMLARVLYTLAVPGPGASFTPLSSGNYSSASSSPSPPPYSVLSLG